MCLPACTAIPSTRAPAWVYPLQGKWWRIMAETSGRKAGRAKAPCSGCCCRRNEVLYEEGLCVVVVFAAVPVAEEHMKHVFDPFHGIRLLEIALYAQGI